MAKGNASNIADKIKWLLAIGIFSAAIVGNGYYTEVAFLYRVLAVVALFILAIIILATTVFGSGAVKLMRESRTEMRRVVWPSRMETTQTLCSSIFWKKSNGNKFEQQFELELLFLV